MIVTNVATKQTDKGVAPQSPFEESATTSARWPVRNRVTFGVVSHPGSPFLSVFFLKSQMNSSQKSSKKGLTKKKNRQTKIKTFLAGSRARPGPCFEHPNVRYQSQNLSKGVPKTSSGSPLRGQLMGTSGFSSVVGTLLKLRLRRKKKPISIAAKKKGLFFLDTESRK